MQDVLVYKERNLTIYNSVGAKNRVIQESKDSIDERSLTQVSGSKVEIHFDISMATIS